DPNLSTHIGIRKGTDTLALNLTLALLCEVAQKPEIEEFEQVPEDVKAARLEALQQLLNAQQLAFNKTSEGKVMDVLIERLGGRPGQVAGRSPYMQAVNLEASEDLVGSIISCRVIEAKQNSVVGAVA
ncbi:MAG: TRAM domain-containing protein, partial [Candidatus Puniceispirillaceae bacterium]